MSASISSPLFAETLIITLLILLVGFFFGLSVETSRIGKVIDTYESFEVEALDLKLQNYYYQIMDQASCDVAIEQNFIFADEIYTEGLKIARFEESNELTEGMLLEKKKYVLLKTELWLNTILLKEKCVDAPHTVVYVYSQETNPGKDAEQAAISNILRRLKEDRGNSIVLIPIAGDLGLNAVDMQLRIHDVSYLPSIIINEEFVLETSLIGDHNRENIIGCCTLARELNIDVKSIQNAVKRFTGIKRRLEVRFEEENLKIIDDFASSPPKVNGSLQALRDNFQELSFL